MAQRNLLPQQQEIVIKEKETNGKLPRVIEKYYDSNRKLNGMAILVQEGTMSLTGKQFAQWHQGQYPELKEVS